VQQEKHPARPAWEGGGRRMGSVSTAVSIQGEWNMTGMHTYYVATVVHQHQYHRNQCNTTNASCLSWVCVCDCTLSQVILERLKELDSIEI